jgi:predicted transcriptional regulator
LTTKRPKKRQKGDSAVKALTDSKVLADIAAGKTVGQVAKEMGMHRTTVSKILNSDETKAKVKEIQGRLAGLIDQSLETLVEALENRALDMNLAVSVARDILKNFGAMQSKVEVDHKFPRPVVIQRLNGSTVILGTMADAKGEEEE